MLVSLAIGSLFRHKLVQQSFKLTVCVIDKYLMKSETQAHKCLHVLNLIFSIKPRNQTQCTKAWIIIQCCTPIASAKLTSLGFFTGNFIGQVVHAFIFDCASSSYMYDSLGSLESTHEARVPPSYASSSSYASFVLSLSSRACIITRCTLKHKSIVKQSYVASRSTLQ